MTKHNPNCLHCRIFETIDKFRADVRASGQDLPLDTAAALQSLAAVMSEIVEGHQGDRMGLMLPHILLILSSGLPEGFNSGTLSLHHDDGSGFVYGFDNTGEASEDKRPEVLQ